VTGVQTIRMWKKQYSDALRLLKKEEAKMEKLKESDSVYEVSSSERRIASMREEIGLIEKKIIESWVSDD